MRRFYLDEQLAHGADPASSPELGLRAEQLLRDRAKLAVAIERALDSARRPALHLSPRVPVRRASVLDCAGELIALSERLRESGPTDPRGVAMVSLLVHDGAGPLYADKGVTLRYSVRSARLALDPLGEAFTDVPLAA